MKKPLVTSPVKPIAKKKIKKKIIGQRIPNKLVVRGINKIKPDGKELRGEACAKAVLNVEKVNDEYKVNHSIKPEINVITKIHNVGEYAILPKGLVNSIQFSITSHSEHVKIGIYKPKTNVPLEVREFQISAKQFSPNANKHSFVDSNAIDCYTATQIDGWKDKRISYMPTDIGNKAVSTFASQRKSVHHVKNNY